jgi:hypothetical protein
MGHISQEWENIQGPTQTQTHKTRSAFLWGANVVELSLQYSIELWEQRNTEVHGSTHTERNQKLLERHQTTIHALLEHKTHILPSDAYLFDDIEELLNNPNPRALGNWIATRKPVIKTSIQKAKLAATENTHSILNWFRPSKPTMTHQGGRKWRQNKLLHDSYSKKKRRRRKLAGDKHQPDIAKFLSLRSII